MLHNGYLTFSRKNDIIINVRETTHINGLISFYFPNYKQLCLLAGSFSSIPFDFYIKILNKSNLYGDNANMLPVIDSKYNKEIIVRTLLLNCLTDYYSDLWASQYDKEFNDCLWSKQDVRLSNDRFLRIKKQWCWDYPLRSDYERRQALIELDVLVAMSLCMTLDQLKTIYTIQFPVLQQYESDTWYDSNGKIVFTTNRSLSGVGFTRAEFENGIKDAAAGQVFKRSITDDTQPGGPVERTIEYVAPFDKCDREKDYETAWKFFEAKYGKEGE